jgi:hypothetical protein
MAGLGYAMKMVDDFGHERRAESMLSAATKSKISSRSA